MNDATPAPDKRELLARLLREKSRRAIPRRASVAPAPLSFAQQRLWFLDQLEPGSPLYNVSLSLKLSGPLNAGALHRALSEIVRRHDALRTRFALIDQTPMQLIAPPAELVLPLVDLSELPEAAREAEAIRLARIEASLPFRLDAGPLFRATLLRFADNEHALLLVMHHIISDGWSLGVLRREIAAVYAAYLSNRSPLLPELPVQYADYAIWQRKTLSGEILDRQLAYWKNQLEGAPQLLELPADYPRPAMQSFKGARRTTILDGAMTQALRELSRRHNATLFMTLLAAFAVLLARYTRGDDIVVGSPIAGRTRVEIENLIGFFVNTLVLRTGCSGNPPFIELLSRVRETALSAYAHQDIPFEKLVEELKPERSLSHSPLFQVLFVLQNAGPAELDLPGVTASKLEFERVNTKFDLSLAAIETGAELRLDIEYSTDLFTHASIDRLIGHYETLLGGIIAAPTAKLAQLPLMTETQRERVLIAWNDTETDYPKHATIANLFEAQVEKTPDAIAVAFEDEQLSYTELNERANRLAHHLISLGVGREVVVGVCLDRSIELIVALLAILKAGGAYLPLDSDYPQERLSFMLADARAPILITSDSLSHTLPECSARLLSVDQMQRFTGNPPANPQPRATPDDLAYVIYTSGSTGTPKGVTIPNRGVIRLVKNTNYADFNSTDIFLQFAPVSFDASTFEIWGALLNGARLVVMPSHRVALEDLADALIRERITTLWLTASLFHLMADQHLDALVRLRQLLAGGDVLSVAHVKKFLAAAPACRLINGYGPTENTTFTCCYSIPHDAQFASSVPIGTPIANTQVYVLDEHMNPVPIGVPGELHIGGAGLARGYLNRPELTAEKFIPNPFSNDPGSRLYKTGDLARYLPDGNIEFLGRLDTQVKIRGFRIEPGEIEAVLNQNPGVKACAVITREDAPGNKRLIAYIVPIENSTASGELRDFLRQKLPGYMLPSAFVMLDALPLTANGKLDRRTLPEPDYSGSEKTYVAPRTPTEEMLAAIWAEVLKLEKIGIHHNFFDLGGHSLLATQVISRVRSAFNVELPLRALFEMPTIEALSREVAKHLGGDVERSLTTIPRRTSRGAAPLSFAQQRLWFLDQLEPASAAYHMPIALRLRGALNVMALRASLSEIVRRHEALRTTFAAAGNEPAHVIRQPHPIDLAVNDLSQFAPPAREDEALRLASGEAKRPFSLASGPLFRVRLFKLDDEHHLLVLVIHHIVCDGWSMSVLSRELSALYRAHVKGERSPLTELPIQYADYAVWQRSWFEERELQRQLSYWKKQLDAAPPLSEFPSDYARPASQRYQGARESLTISKELAGKLTLLSRREGVTLFMTLLAAFKVLLCRYSGQEDLLIGTHIAGRNRRELEGMIGFFIGTLALRTCLSGNPAFREVLARVREVALGAYAHQDVPFERLVEELEPERSLSHTPLVQVVFNMLNLPDIAIDLPGLTVTRLPLGAGGPKFDLTLYAGEREEGIVFNAVYNTDLFQAATIKRALRHFETLLQGIVADPGCRLSKLPLLTKSEAALRSNEVCPTQAFGEFSAAAIEQSIARRFEQQARHCANSLAIKTRTHEWSYEELNRAANRTAHALLRLRGGGAERVALLLDHDAPMIAAVLGVLKTGKSYVPLDPAYPRERLAYMLADAQPEVLLTDSANLALAQILSNLRPLNIDAFESLNSNVDVLVSPGAVAYTLYTSGSTGQPKGVVQNHRNVLHFIRAYTNNLHISANDRLTLFSSYTFDSSVQDIFAALLNGAALYPVNLKEESLGDAVQWLIGNGITIYHSTPSTYRHFIRALTGEEAFSAVRLIVLGGEAAFKADVDAYRKHFPASCLFVNGFGLTESTVNLQYFVDHKTEVSRNSVPIGYPAADTEIVLLDDDGEPTQLYGEIGIRSSHVALGYWNQSALTRARFINDAVDANKRIYRTGDMGRVLPDGSLEFAGRKDNQVKLRGYRIELGEIEAVLAGHPAVRECAAVLNEKGMDSIIAAYIVPNERGNVSRAELGAFLKGKLPDYMIPSAFVALDHLPLTASGKTNYRELSRRDDVRVGPDVAFVAPRTPSEQTLAAIWAEVLKLERIGIHDNFFNLGGHSLLATQVMSRVKRTFELDIPLRALFESPTVAGLSAHIVQSQAEALSEGELRELLAEVQDQR